MTKVLSFQKMSTRFLIGVGLILAAFVLMGSISIARANMLNHNLNVGMSGTDVSVRQPN